MSISTEITEGLLIFGKKPIHKGAKTLNSRQPVTDLGLLYSASVFESYQVDDIILTHDEWARLLLGMAERFISPKGTPDQMDFNFYIPNKLEGLSPMIWEQKSDCAQNWNILPDGHLDLVFRFDDPWTIYSETYTSRSYNPTEQFCFLSGLQTKPINVSFSQTHVMGVRLNTVAVKLIFGLPCSELVDWAIDGDDILSKEIGMIENTIQELPDFYARAIWLEDFIHSIIRYNADFSVAIRISRLLNELTYNRIHGQPFDVCKMTGYSRMHTYRIFKEWFGLSPSQAISMKQFIAALDHMHQEPETLTQVALANGFYDQPHFVRVFRQYTGMNPRQYLNNRTNIVGQLPF